MTRSQLSHQDRKESVEEYIDSSQVRTLGVHLAPSADDIHDKPLYGILVLKTLVYQEDPVCEETWGEASLK